MQGFVVQAYENVGVAALRTGSVHVVQLDGGEADIEEIRLIRDPRGRVKGFAYLQLRDKALVPTAITKLNNQKL